MADHDYVSVQAGDDFQRLRSSFRRFVFPWTAFFLCWYFLYVILAAFFPSFMSTRITGTITVGLVFGLLQFATTFALTIHYVRWAGRTLDPQATAIRDAVEGAREGGAR